MPNNGSASPILRLDGIWKSICKRGHISFVVEIIGDSEGDMGSFFDSDSILAFLLRRCDPFVIPVFYSASHSSTIRLFHVEYIQPSTYQTEFICILIDNQKHLQAC